MFSDDNSENEMGITSDDISELNELAGHDKNFTEFQNLPSIPQLHQNIIEKLEKLIESIHHLHETNDTEPLLICIDNVINLVASSNRRITILDSKVINDTVGSIMSVMMIENDLIRTKIVELLTSLCDLFQFLVNNDNSQQFSFILQQLILSNNQDLSKKTKKFLQKLFEVQDNSTQLLFILYSFIMSNVSSNILENDIDLQIIRQFVNKLNGSSQYKINMQQLFIFLAPYFRLSPVDGKIPDVTVYSSWILADIFSKNTIGTPRLAQDTQIFVFLSNFLNYDDPRILNPVLNSIQYVMSSFPNAEILCTDIQTSRLVNLLEISDVTKSAALCIAAIITREIDEMCDLNIKETLLVAYKMIQDSDSSTQKSLLYLIKLCIDVIHAEDAADIFIDSKQINFISIIHQFCGTGKSDVEAETLDAFMRLFVKLQNLNKHQQLLEEFVQSGCFNLLEEMRDTENDELVEIIDAIIEYLRVDEE